MKKPKYEYVEYRNMMRLPNHINDLEKKIEHLDKWIKYHAQKKSQLNRHKQNCKDLYYNRDGTKKID